MSIVSAAPRAKEQELLTSEDFLDWLEPGVFADLIGGEIIVHSPVNLRHARLVNFMDRLLGGYIENGNLGEFGAEPEKVHSSSIHGFWIKRTWLNPAKLPGVSACLAEMLGSPRTNVRRRRA